MVVYCGDLSCTPKNRVETPFAPVFSIVDVGLSLRLAKNEEHCRVKFDSKRDQEIRSHIKDFFLEGNRLKCGNVERE